MTAASADGISLILSEDARIENGKIANLPYLAVKIAEAVESGIYNGFKLPHHAPFYGSQCSDYPKCNGGCGLGCTYEIVNRPPPHELLGPARSTCK
jgi:hypothetical protein